MIVEVKNVSKKFKNIPVLSDVNLEFKSGKIYGLIGRNGSGKSVFLKILCGFYEPTSGAIIYDNVDINKEGLFPARTRALIEKPYFLPDLSGYKNLKLLAELNDPITSDEAIEEVLKELDLYEDKDKKYKEYSLGMKQKLGIAQVLMDDPEVIILDEPFNGVEDKTVEKIRKLLLSKAKEGKTIIIATHIKDDIEKLVDVLYKFDGGKVTIVDK